MGIVLVIATGCGEQQGEQADPSASHPPVTPAPATSAPDPKAEVRRAVAAYRSMWGAFVAASNAGDADPADLGRYTGGSALPTLKRGLALNKSRGLTSKGAPTLAPRVTSVGPVAAPISVTVSDCVDSTNWLLYKQNGQPADDDPGGRRKVTATVAKTGETWKVTGFAAREVGTC